MGTKLYNHFEYTKYLKFYFYLLLLYMYNINAKM